MKLTIAIPSYNRPAQLNATVRKLLPQLTNECFLLILDNQSDISVAEQLGDAFVAYPNVKYEIARNKKNVGADANIVRCFELCDTEWLWTLGDDDLIADNAIELVFRDIADYSEAVLINYYSPCSMHPVRNKTICARGRHEFVANTDFFGAAIFISANVYNAKRLQKHWLANSNTYSCCTQWLITYFSLSDTSLTVQSDTILCYNAATEAGEASYSAINLSIARGFATLFDLPLSKKEKKVLIARVLTVANQWITLESIVKCLLVEYYRSGKELDILFLLRRYYHAFYKHGGAKLVLKSYLYYICIFISPKLSFNAIRLLLLKQKGMDINHYIN